MKMIKRDSENRQEINTETYVKKKKLKKENMGKNKYCNMSEEKKEKLKGNKLRQGKKVSIK